MSNFFIKCSGANPQVLKQCPTERGKFSGIGATIFTTSLLASISGGYATYFTFNNFFISGAFGLVWGFIIFNLDRYIVSSIKKSTSLYSQFFTAMPRILIAIVLAVTISKPLELRLFDGTISKRLGQKEDQYNKDCEQNFIEKRNKLDATKTSLLNELDIQKNSLFKNDPLSKDIENQVKEKTNSNLQLSGQVSTNNEIIQKNSWLVDTYSKKRLIKIRKYNPVAQAKISENKNLLGLIETNKLSITSLGDSLKSRKSNLSDQIKNIEIQYTSQIAGVQNQIDSLNKKRPEILEKCRREAALDRDILSRLNALGDLKKLGNTVWWASLMITLLFILIETAPIIVKLMAKRGPYDEILDRMEYEIFLEQQKIISEKNNEVNITLEEMRDQNKLNGDMHLKVQQAKIDAELKGNEELLNKIASKQASLAEIMIEDWYSDQVEILNKARKNKNSNNGFE